MGKRKDQDKLNAKIWFLREKYRSENGTVNTSKGSEFIKELTAWMEEQQQSLDYEQMAVAASRGFYESHKAYQDMDKLDKETGSLFEEEALIATSIDQAETIQMGDADQSLWLRHIVVTNSEFGRQSAAFARKSAFQSSRFEAFRYPGELLRDVEQRLKRRDDDKSDKQAAD